MMNPQPISNRKKVHFLIALTILAWATQTLLHQWARGGDVPVPPGDDAVAQEHFVPNVGGGDVAVVLEVRSEATVHGRDIQLRQICRWANADARFFVPLADLTVARFANDKPFVSVSLDDLRQTLHDAGVNLGIVRFAGATSCTVARSDAKYDEAAALQQWADARQGKSPAAGPLESPATDSAMPASEKTRPLAIAPADEPPTGRETSAPAASSPTAAPTPASANDNPVHTLRERITADASIRLKVPADQLQVTFNPADERILNLAEPQFKFNLEARRVFGLGDVAWDVLIVTETGNRKVPIAATARAWQKQLILTRPLAFKQVIRPEDVVEKRVLVDRLTDDPLLTMAQAVGQEAARELKPGAILTSRMVSPVDLAKVGQFITVTMASGGIHVKTVGRAMEAGTFGQTVKVKNEATGAIYEVVLTGPQEGTISPPRSADVRD